MRLIHFPSFLRLRAHTARAVLNPRVLIHWWSLWKSAPVFDWIIGAQHFRDGNYEVARTYYRRGLLSAPKHRAAGCARLDYAYCLYRCGEWLDAKDELIKLTLQAPLMREAFMLFAEIELVLGRPQAAVNVLKRFLLRNPNDPVILGMVTHSSVAAGVSPEKLIALREKLTEAKQELDLEDEGVDSLSVALAQIEYALGEEQIGDQLLARVMATGVCPIEGIVLRAERLIKQRRFIQARKHLDRALKSSPRHPRIYALLARTYLGERSSNEAAWAVRLALLGCQHSFWQNAEVLQTLVAAYEQNNEKDAALLVALRMRKLASVSELNLDSLKSLQVQLERLRSGKSKATPKHAEH